MSAEMSDHTRALLCRLAACEIDNETHSAANLRRTLRDAGLSEAAIEAAVARIREAIEITGGAHANDYQD